MQRRFREITFTFIEGMTGLYTYSALKQQKCETRGRGGAFNARAQDVV